MYDSLQFDPDIVFAQIANTFYKRDCFQLQDLMNVCSLYGQTVRLTANNMYDFKTMFNEHDIDIPTITRYQHIRAMPVNKAQWKKCSR